ncbi:MAG: hypothetical protein OXI52_13260 [Caldilineaceae bacterium]|nr:hypothetical protein [Caldilineaceae bacterium]
MRRGFLLVIVLLFAALAWLSVYAFYSESGELIDLSACQSEVNCTGIKLLIWFLVPLWLLLFGSWLFVLLRFKK